MMNNRAWLVVILMVVLFAFVAVASFSNKSTTGNVVDEPVVCEQDVKYCSDGGYVSRNPDKNCEFDLCPSEIEDLCLSLTEEECVANELCEPAYLYKGCSEDVCNNPKIYNKCSAK